MVAYPGAEVLPILFDAADEDSIITAINKTIDVYDRIDYAVNNAGLSGPVAASTEVGAKDFRRCLDVNLMGYWIGQREQIRRMLKQDPLPAPKGMRRNRGVIVNTASMLAIVGTGDNTPATAYAASKHAVMAITKSVRACLLLLGIGK
jgi:NAD(P)-dependent dehydrogenase (short-subunit alcohol dehydrogenase family)